MRALPVMVVLALLATQLGGCAAKGRGTRARMVEAAAPVATVTEAAPVKPDPVMEVGPDVMADPRTPGQLPMPYSARLARDDAGYSALTEYVLAVIGDGKPLPGRSSALIDQPSLARVPRMKLCADQRPALILDLDHGGKPFDLGDAPTPEAGLAEQLRVIRGRGVAVVWLATLPESAERDVLTMVKATGLDPLGIDRALLLRRGEVRKQQILNRADEDWCVLAIGGDNRSDFDEVFDYLRNPDGPVALALEQYIGAGWFVVPPPIR